MSAGLEINPFHCFVSRNPLLCCSACIHLASSTFDLIALSYRFEEGRRLRVSLPASTEIISPTSYCLRFLYAGLTFYFLANNAIYSAVLLGPSSAA